MKDMDKSSKLSRISAMINCGILVLLCALCFCSCSEKEESQSLPTYVYRNELLFCDSLVYELQELVESKTSQTISERFDFFSINAWRMVKETFAVEDSIRKYNWAQAFKDNGLDSKDIEELINQRVLSYNKHHPNEKLSFVKIAELSDTVIVDNDAFEDIKNLDLIGTLDVIDVVFTFVPLITWIIFYPIGFIIGFVIFRPIFKICGFPERDTLKTVYTILISSMVIIVFLFLIYHSIRLSSELEGSIITNYINYLNSLDLPSQIIK